MLGLRVAESEVFGWSWSRIPNNTGSRSRIFCPTPCAQLDHFLHHTPKLGKSCWNGTISFVTFVESEIPCDVPRFSLISLILTVKFHSLYFKESGSENLERSESGVGIRNLGNSESEFWNVGVGIGSRIFYLRLRNLAWSIFIRSQIVVVIRKGMIQDIEISTETIFLSRWK